VPLDLRETRRLLRLTLAAVGDLSGSSRAAIFDTDGSSPRFSASMTLVVMPDECQSIPITAPNNWDQNRRRSRERFVAPAMVDDGLADDGAQRRRGTRPPCSGRSALPDRNFIRRGGF
jgi:hypothetical protein